MQYFITQKTFCFFTLKKEEKSLKKMECINTALNHGPNKTSSVNVTRKLRLRSRNIVRTRKGQHSYLVVGKICEGLLRRGRV